VVDEPSAAYDPEWNPDDYLFDFPDVAAYEGELADMPLIHKIVKIRDHLMAVLHEAAACIPAQAELPPLITGLAAVDYLAGFHAGRRSTKEDYLQFLKDFFPSRYAVFAAWIYEDLRCGLMHNLVAMNPWTERGRPYSIAATADHLAEKAGVLHFSISTFLEDVRRAFWRYAHHLVMKSAADGPEVARFHARFNRLSGQGALMEKT
jgi:hypothetical protein